jgi:hypothetical protein
VKLRNRGATARPLAVAAAALLVVLGVAVLAVVSYAPQILGLGDATAFIVVLSLRGLGFVLLLGAAMLLVRTRKVE